MEQAQEYAVGQRLKVVAGGHTLKVGTTVKVTFVNGMFYECETIVTKGRPKKVWLSHKELRLPLKRGFASMGADRRREIAIAGGRKSHETGKAHKWNSQTARIAGSIGGQHRRQGA